MRMMFKMHENIPIYMKFILKIVFHVDAVYLIAACDDDAAAAGVATAIAIDASVTYMRAREK